MIDSRSRTVMVTDIVSPSYVCRGSPSVGTEVSHCENPIFYSVCAELLYRAR